MRSLTAHLLSPGEHGHLPFHPGCSRCCQERLSGCVPSDELFPARSRALLAAAILAGSTVAPLASPLLGQAAAQEESDDENQSGEDEPERLDLEDGGGGGGLDETDDTAIPEDPLPSPENTVPAGPPPTSTPTPEPDVADPQPQPQPAAEEPIPPADPVPPTPSPPEPDPGLDDRPAEQAKPHRQPNERKQPRGEPTDRRDRSPGAGESPPPTRTTPAPAPEGEAPPVAAAPDSPEAPDSARTPDRAPSTPDTKTHVVRPGESLWTIAQGHLGDRATPARVARLVNQLWNLNAERIATGDPDLIMVGTPLRMP